MEGGGGKVEARGWRHEECSSLRGLRGVREAGSCRLKAGGKRLETGSQMLEAGGQRPEARGQRLEAGGWGKAKKSPH